MFVVWIAVVGLAVLNTIAKESVDRQAMSRRTKLAWSALIVVVVSVGGILTVTRAVASAKALAAVDAKYSYRGFTEAQRVALREVLSRHAAPSSPIQIHSVSGDPESAAFGIQLERAIIEAGWPAKHENMAFFGAPHGLQIRFEGKVQSPVDVPATDDASCPPCSALARGLAHVGQPSKVMIWPPTLVDAPSGTIELVVGYKPLNPD